MPDTTLLTLSGIAMPPYAARGITQTLEPITGTAQLRRTVNGELVDLGAPQFRKVRSTITCTDMSSPELTGIWPGMPVTVGWAHEVAGSAVTDGMQAVPGSERTEGEQNFFRPLVEMMVTGWSIGGDEYGASVNWQLQLEEV